MVLQAWVTFTDELLARPKAAKGEGRGCIRYHGCESDEVAVRAANDVPKREISKIKIMVRKVRCCWAPGAAELARGCAREAK